MLIKYISGIKSRVGLSFKTNLAELLILAKASTPRFDDDDQCRVGRRVSFIINLRQRSQKQITFTKYINYIHHCALFTVRRHTDATATPRDVSPLAPIIISLKLHVQVLCDFSSVIRHLKFML